MAARQMIFRLHERNRGMRSRQMTVMLSLKRTEKQEVALSGSKSRRRCLWYGQRPTTKLRRLYAAIQYNLCHGRSSVHARIVRSVQRSMTMAIIVSRTTIRTQNPTPMRTSASIARIITPRAIRTSQRFSAKLGNINHSWQV